MEEMLSFSLTYGDELWHVVLYQWLIDNALTDRLLEVGCRSVFLFGRKTANPHYLTKRNGTHEHEVNGIQNGEPFIYCHELL